MKKPDGPTLVFQALTEIAIIGRLADGDLERTLPSDLSVAGFGILNHFVRLSVEGESPARLAALFQVTKGAMTNTLQRLEARGYIRIDADPHDGRAKIVRMTQAGRVIREKAIARIAPAIGALLTLMPASEFGAMLPTLTKLREILDENRTLPPKAPSSPPAKTRPRR